MFRNSFRLNKLWPRLSAGSGDLLGCVSCCLLVFFGSDSGDVQQRLLFYPPAPSPPAALPTSHALPAPPASAPPTAGSLPAAPPHAAAAPASHPPLQPPAPPPQPPPSCSHDPQWEPWGVRTELRPAALGPGHPPIRDGLVFLPPLTKRKKMFSFDGSWCIQVLWENRIIEVQKSDSFTSDQLLQC